MFQKDPSSIVVSEKWRISLENFCDTSKLPNMSEQTNTCSSIKTLISATHASPNTRLHALYVHFFLGFSQKEVARIFHKSTSTICEWVKQYHKDGMVTRALSTRCAFKFAPSMRQWIVEFYFKNPLAFLDEAQCAIILEFHLNISIASVWSIIHECGMMRKV